MITRIATIVLIVAFALPVTSLTQPAESTPSPWAAATVAAKGKKHKGHHRKQHKKPGQQQPSPTTPGTHIVRQTVTQTFTSAQPITIPNGAPNTEKGPANPYPATIDVSGFANGTVTDVNLILNSFSHDAYADVDVLLSTSDGRQALVISEVDSDHPVTNIDLTLDDEAAAALPAIGQGVDLQSGTFRPTAYTLGNDTFAAPAPVPNGSVALSTFDGANPNGTWRLWVMDDASSDVGDFESWALQITAEVDVQVPDLASTAPAEKPHTRHGSRRR
jgi:hypothetical protein